MRGPNSCSCLVHHHPCRLLDTHQAACAVIVQLLLLLSTLPAGSRKLLRASATCARSCCTLHLLVLLLIADTTCLLHSARRSQQHAAGRPQQPLLMLCQRQLPARHTRVTPGLKLVRAAAVDLHKRGQQLQRRRPFPLQPGQALLRALAQVGDAGEALRGEREERKEVGALADEQAIPCGLWFWEGGIPTGGRGAQHRRGLPTCAATRRLASTPAHRVCLLSPCEFLLQLPQLWHLVEECVNAFEQFQLRWWYVLYWVGGCVRVLGEGGGGCDRAGWGWDGKVLESDAAARKRREQQVRICHTLVRWIGCIPPTVTARFE